MLLEACAAHDVPMPAVNVPLLGFEVDFLWPRHRFVVEADGGDRRGPQRDGDNERDIRLARAGYLVRRYSWRALGHADTVAAEIAAMLAERVPTPRNG